MDRQVYLKKLSHIVRWRLSKPEADAVLADYQEILSQRVEVSDEQLIQELGDPCQAAHLLTEPRAYRLWLAVFALMTSSLLLLLSMLLRVTFFPHSVVIIMAVYGAALAVSLIWFHRHRTGWDKMVFPKGIMFAVFGLMGVSVVAVGILIGLVTQSWAALPPASYGTVVQWTTQLAGVVAAITGVLALVKARVSDLRWQVVYIVALLVLAECVLAMATLTSLSNLTPGWWVPGARAMGIVGLTGFIGVGVSLC